MKIIPKRLPIYEIFSYIKNLHANPFTVSTNLKLLTELVDCEAFLAATKAFNSPEISSALLSPSEMCGLNSSARALNFPCFGAKGLNVGRSVSGSCSRSPRREETLPLPRGFAMTPWGGV